MITLDLGGRRVRYRIEFVNFDPNENIQVELRCVPEELGTAPQSNPAKIDEYIQAQEQAFQKDEAYSKTIITLGYAGLFGIWAFVNPHLSHKAILTTALLAGFSLIIYIGWEVAQMIIRSARQLRFNVALKNHPNDHAKAINDFVAQTRAAMVRGGRIWIVILLFTVLPGFLAALLLIYNVSADLAGLRSLP